MGAPSSRRLARRTTQRSLEAERARLATERHSRRFGSKRRGSESMDETRARRRRRNARSASTQRSKLTVNSGTEGSNPRGVSHRSRELWISGRCVDGQTGGRGDREGIGVRYHRDHVGKLMREVGWSRQQPVERASQRNEEVLKKWSDERWPQIKKKPTRTKRLSSG